MAENAAPPKSATRGIYTDCLPFVTPLKLVKIWFPDCRATQLCHNHSLSNQLVGTLRSTPSTSTTHLSKQNNSSCKTRMNNFYSPRHSQHRRRYDVTQTIFTSSGRRQLAEWNKLLLKIEFYQRLRSFEENWSYLRSHKTSHMYQAR